MSFSMNPMFRKLTLGVICLSITSVLQLDAQSFNAGSVDAGLLKELQQATDDSYHEVFILFKDRVNPELLEQTMLRANLPQEKRVTLVLESLQEKAKKVQQPVLDLIRQSKEVDQSQVETYWIANMVFVRARKAFIATLSQRPDIAWIEKNETLENQHATAAPVAAPMVPNGREPGLNTINAPAMWALGYTGYGRKVLIVDSGQDTDHPALRNQFAYNYASLSSTYTSQVIPDYCDSHGTSVASAAVGLDPLTRDTIGVAFNAKWMGAPFSNLRNVETGDFCEYKGSVRDVSSVLQWALNPDGNTSTTADMPDVINNSYGRKLSSTVECSQVWPELFRALDVVGIAVVFAAGNDGPSASSVNLQASISINDVTPFAVGALNGSSNLMADFSGRGPSLCSNFQNTTHDIKPEVVAPGVNIRVATLGKAGYEFVNGTSFAAPYVAGAILLLKEAFPALPGRELARALYNSATDLGTIGEDNDSGKGLINVFSAYNYLISRGFKPTPPIAPTVDVAHLNAAPRLLNCGGQIYMDVTFRNEGTEVLNAVDIVVRREFNTTPLVTKKWTGALAPGATTTYVLQEFPSGFGGYTIEVELRNPNGKTDERPLNNQLKKKAVVSPQPMLPPVSVAATTVCSTGRTLITSSYAGNATLRWYNRSDGGTALGQGLSYYTGPLTSDTTIFAELRFLEKVGKPNNTDGTTALSDSTTGGLVFDCLAPFTLKTVQVYVATAGPRNIRLRRPDGSIQQRLVNVPRVGVNRLTLDFSIEPGEGFILDFSVGRELYVSKTGTTFPYTVPGVLTIQRSESIDPTVYSYFYDWEVEYNYPCGRLPVRIGVDKSITGVKAGFAAPDSTVLSTEGAVVNFQNTSTAATQYSWNLGDGNVSTVESPVHTYAKAGKYQVVLTATTGGCSDVALKMVSVTAVTGLETIEQVGGSIRLYPNPTQGVTQVDLKLSTPDEVQVLLYDLLGRKLEHWDLGRVEEVQTNLNLSRFPAGAYQVLFMGNTFRHRETVILEK